MPYNKEQLKEWRKNNLQNGLCMSCGDIPPRAGRTTCTDCAGKNAENARKRRDKAKQSGMCVKCKTQARADDQLQCQACLDYMTEHRLQVKLEAFNAYGGPHCRLCNYSKIAGLSIDHIDGGGCNHRRSEGLGSGQATYYWLKKNAWPLGYRVLCMNCQFEEKERIKYQPSLRGR